MKTWHNRGVEKQTWGDGPWIVEPDKAHWIDPETGLDCLIHRGPSGALCGYVGLPPGHPFHGVHYGELVDVDVHGGLTFADACMETDDEGHGVCHVPEPGRPADVWWLGFDCGHVFDLSPGLAARMRELERADPTFPRLPDGFRADVYRGFDYVRRQVGSLAKQLAAQRVGVV